MHSRLPAVSALPGPVSAATDVEYEGFGNSATYLAHLYLWNDGPHYKAIQALIRNDNTLAAEDLKGYVDALPPHRCLKLDAWASGEVRWQEVADTWTADLEKGLSQAFLRILSGVVVEGNLVKIPGQVDRRTYLELDKCLGALGGKWNRKLRAHVFEADPTSAIEDVLLTGRYQRPDNLGAFFTGTALAEELAAKAGLTFGMSMLEPSAGAGAIADACAKRVGRENVFCVELQQKHAEALATKGYRVHRGDFLEFSPPSGASLFDRVVMNPPFARQQDIEHVVHAYSMLKPGGRLVAVMAASVAFRENRKTLNFRDLVEECGGHLEQNAKGAFRESGTDVSTVTLTLDKPDTPILRPQRSTVALA